MHPAELAASPWRAEATADGSWSLRNTTVDELCHSHAGAWQQARERYARACRIAERARAADERTLRLLDVGTGLGLNVAAALAALDGTGVALDAVTLELDPAVITEGCALYARLGGGPWEPWHGEVRRALGTALDAAVGGGTVELGRGGRLTLVLGDARATLAALPPARHDAVFLDPFSPRRAPELWEEPFLAEVAGRMASGAWLSTYSASFRVRLALVRAGLRVGRGPRVGAKGEGTLASPDRDPPALPSRTVRRLSRRRVGPD